MTSPHLTIRQLAERWQVARSTVRSRIGKRELAAIRIGDCWRIPEEEVRRYERRMSVGGAS